jgi:hypothetical protein
METVTIQKEKYLKLNKEIEILKDTPLFGFIFNEKKTCIDHVNQL